MEDRNINKAFDYFDSAFKLGTSLSKRTTLSMLTGMGIREHVLRSVKDIIDQPELSKKDLRIIENRLDEWSSITFADKETWKEYAEIETTFFAEKISSELLRDNVEHYLGSHFVFSKKEMANAARSFWKYTLEAPSLRGMQQRTIKWTASMGESLHSAHVTPQKVLAFTLPMMLTDAYERAIKTLLQEQAKINILRAYTAAVLFKKINGKLPATWEELVPLYMKEIPPDPFSEGKLKLTLKNKSLIIYSVGNDGKDNGGVGSFYEENNQNNTEEKKEQDISLTLSL